MDIDAIPFGEDFRDYIDEALKHAVAMVLVIGPRWLGTKRRGTYRIQDVTDPVRIEVETAMRLGIRIVPVLVEDATMPQPSDLPETLAKLPFINAATVDSGRDFRIHMERVIRALELILERSGTGVAARPEPEPKRDPPASRPVKPVAIDVAPVPPAPAPEPKPTPVAKTPPNREEIAARILGAWWVSLARGLILTVSAILIFLLTRLFRLDENGVALAFAVVIGQMIALVLMIRSAKGVRAAQIAFGVELLLYCVGLGSFTSQAGVVIVGTARTIAEVWAGASLGRYARAEYARIVVAGVVFLLTLVLVGLAAATSSPTRRMIYAAVADLVAGLGFIVLGLILRSAKARAATR